MLYAGENGGIVIPLSSGTTPINGGPSNVYWYQKDWKSSAESPLAAYTGGADALMKMAVCPENAAPIPAAIDSYGQTIKNSYGYPYVVNYAVMVENTRANKGEFVRLNQIRNASRLPMITDSKKGADWRGGGWEAGKSTADSPTGRIGSPHADGRTNVLWCDGHVSLSTPIEVNAAAVEAAKP
jgi:prepilin-type processing-associated H-X9-DG protein